jgi:hypothetical protein
VLVAPTTSHAQDHRVAVLEVAAAPERSGTTGRVVAAVRDGVALALEGSGHTLVRGDGGRRCGVEVTCAVEAGRAWGATAVVVPRETVLGGQVVLEVDLVDVASSRGLDQEQVMGQDVDALVARVPLAVAGLVRRGLGLGRHAELRLAADVRTVRLDLSKVRAASTPPNPRAERALEEAMSLQPSASARADDKREKWCALALVTENNRYLELARSMCDGWTASANLSRRLERSIPEDYDKVAQFMRRRDAPAPERQAAAERFLANYDAYRGHPLVRQVRGALGDLKRGINPWLPTQEEMDARRLAEEQARAEQQAKEHGVATREEAGRSRQVVDTVTPWLKPLLLSGLYGLLGLVQVAGALVFVVGVPLILAYGIGFALMLVGGVMAGGVTLAVLVADLLWGNTKGPVLGWTGNNLGWVGLFFEMVLPVRAADQLSQVPRGVREARGETPAGHPWDNDPPAP